MVVGMIPLLSAPFGRLAEYPYLLQHVFGPSLVVIALGLIDLKILGRLHPVTKFLGIGVLAWELVPNLYMHTETWLAIAAWLVQAGG